jgi:hypothetical protein
MTLGEQRTCEKEERGKLGAPEETFVNGNHFKKYSSKLSSQRDGSWP